MERERERGVSTPLPCPIWSEIDVSLFEFYLEWETGTDAGYGFSWYLLSVLLILHLSGK